MVTETDVRVTYKELDQKASAIADAVLRKTGDYGLPHLVGIMMERDVGFIAAILGNKKNAVIIYVNIA